jgi:hypothetical protein
VPTAIEDDIFDVIGGFERGDDAAPAAEPGTPWARSWVPRQLSSGSLFCEAKQQGGGSSNGSGGPCKAGLWHGRPSDWSVPSMPQQHAALSGDVVTQSPSFVQWQPGSPELSGIFSPPNGPFSPPDAAAGADRLQRLQRSVGDFGSLGRTPPSTLGPPPIAPASTEQSGSWPVPTWELHNRRQRSNVGELPGAALHAMSSDDLPVGRDLSQPHVTASAEPSRTLLVNVAGGHAFEADIRAVFTVSLRVGRLCRRCLGLWHVDHA